MARRKTKTRRAPVARRTRRRRPSPIGRIMKRRRSSSRSSGSKSTIMDAVTVSAGLVAGQYLGKMLQDKVSALEDGKIRGAALAALGIFGGRMLPKGFQGVALGVAASGIYQLAKEVMPDTIAGIDDSVGQLTAAEVDLIENMALESEVTGLDEDVDSTVGMDLDAEVVSTVTGADEDDDDDSEDY